MWVKISTAVDLQECQERVMGKNYYKTVTVLVLTSCHTTPALLRPAKCHIFIHFCILIRKVVLIFLVF